MIAVIFEVRPLPEQRQRYLDLAAALAAHLREIDGFVSVERFQSLGEPDKLLSLSFWRDEQAVMRWRSTEEHRRAQTLGRDEVFRGYRLRVASVLRDYSLDERDQAPADSRGFHG